MTEAIYTLKAMEIYNHVNTFVSSRYIFQENSNEVIQLLLQIEEPQKYLYYSSVDNRQRYKQYLAEIETKLLNYSGICFSLKEHLKTLYNGIIHILEDNRLELSEFLKDELTRLEDNFYFKVMVKLRHYMGHVRQSETFHYSEHNFKEEYWITSMVISIDTLKEVVGKKLFNQAFQEGVIYKDKLILKELIRLNNLRIVETVNTLNDLFHPLYSPYMNHLIELAQLRSGEFGK